METKAKEWRGRVRGDPPAERMGRRLTAERGRRSIGERLRSTRGASGLHWAGQVGNLSHGFSSWREPDREPAGGGDQEQRADRGDDEDGQAHVERVDRGVL